MTEELSKEKLLASIQVALASGVDGAVAFRRSLNTKLEGIEPLQLVLGTVLVLLLVNVVVDTVKAVVRSVEDNGVKGAFVNLAMSVLSTIPGVAGLIQREKDKVTDKLRKSLEDDRTDWLTELPKEGLGKDVLKRMEERKESDKKWEGVCSGTVYIGGDKYEEHMDTVLTALRMFAHTNPLHADVFPSVTRFEAEVIAMTAGLLGGHSKEAGGDVCGNMTSGGSESILMAVKSSRDYMRAMKGITAPELVVAESAHPAYDKACRYFKIRLRRSKVGNDFRADVRAMARLINSNTIMIIGSAPGYPHGLIDPIKDLGALALEHDICFHVDCCLGGFVLPFAKKLGYPIPPFDFEVPGVTSISADTHKYGLGPKGSSVVLYRNRAIRRHQFVAVTEWTGGLYTSPSAAGSRPGGLIAAAWAALVSVGEIGFLEVTRQIMEASRRIEEGIEKISGLYVVGKPDMTVVAFASPDLNVYQINDEMVKRGWSLNALQRPASLHICVTLQHVTVVDRFLEDLASAVEAVRANPAGVKEGSAPLYGAASTMPHRGTVRDLLDVFLETKC